jgi:hypothetical protein
MGRRYYPLTENKNVYWNGNILIGIHPDKKCRLLEKPILKKHLWQLFFRHGEDFDIEKIYFTMCCDYESLAAEIGCYPSKSQARKAGRIGEIPQGYIDDYKFSKDMPYVVIYNMTSWLAFHMPEDYGK